MIKLNENMNEPYHGEVEIIIKDRCGHIVQAPQKNIIKIFAKEILSHRAPATKVWDPDAIAPNTDQSIGYWVDNETADPNEDFSLKYILIGASFDDDGRPLDVDDSRYYEFDPSTGYHRPITLTPGATHGGSIINAVPINEACNRPLKRIENFSFKPTYQPSSTPYLHTDVRAMNNIMIAETVLRTEEYNGFSNLPGEYFTITEVALVAGKYVGSISDCNIDPHDVLMDGPFIGSFTDSYAVQLNNPTDGGFFHVGDQIKIIDPGSSSFDFNQKSPFYLVVDKSCTNGVELILDRIPTDNVGNILTGSCDVFRDTLRIFAHRILSVPIKKSADFEITIRWSIYFS